MLDTGIIHPAVDGFILVERETTTGLRRGLMALIDLEMYDYEIGGSPLIRPTEGTIVERIPPRVRIRENMPIETPHTMLLADDPDDLLIGPLYARRHKLRKLYEFDLMMGGGHLTGWAVDAKHDIEGILDAATALFDGCDGLLLAVGDGNHSLATARQCWRSLRSTLDEARRAVHPARFALVEIVNLGDPALVFEPIHRMLDGVDSRAVLHGFKAYLHARGCQTDATDGQRIVFVDALGEELLVISPAIHPLAVGTLQDYLDALVSQLPGADVDYIHGEAALRKLSAEDHRAGFLLPAMDKAQLFPAVRADGALPRKTFSMGEAQDKRYYLECRRIVP